jgi:hypothetical protein
MNGGDNLDKDDIHDKAIKLIQTKNDNEIYEIIAMNFPQSSINLLEQMQKENLKLISGPDRLLLSEPIDPKKLKENGSKLNHALKRVVWKTLCDPENEVYKSWSSGLSLVHDKKYIAAAVTSVFIKQEICFGMIAASIVALAIRFGVSVFCEIYEPGILMESPRQPASRDRLAS